MTQAKMSDPRTERVAALKPGQYADGSPLHDVQYLECKLILKTDEFTSSAGFRKYGKLVAKVAQGMRRRLRHVGGEGRAPRRDVPRQRGCSPLQQRLHPAPARARQGRLPGQRARGHTGRDLRLNVSAAIPAVLLDVGFPADALKGVPILARCAGLIGHLSEEMVRPIGFALSYQATREQRYTGTLPQGVTLKVES